MPFPCTGCGACCRRVGLVKGHGLPVKADGSCGNLVDNRCAIYATRPDVCRIDKLVDAMSERLGVDRQELLQDNADLCNAFQREDGMPESYRVLLVEPEA
jgi:Fe-S-cluster containining protein